MNPVGWGQCHLFPKFRVEKFNNMHCKNPALDATTTHCSVFTNTSRHDRFAAATTLQSGLATAETHIDTTTKKSFLQKIPQDEAKRIAKDEIETDIFAKDEIKTDVYDLTERSGRAVKVSSQVTIIFIFCFTFVCL